MIDFIIYLVSVILLVYAAKQAVVLFMFNKMKVRVENENNEDQTHKFKMKLIAQIIIPSILSISMICFGIS